jgi:hypothetical protein
MLANTNLSLEQNTINVPKEVQFYTQNQDIFTIQQPQPIFVSKEIKELVEKSGLFKEEDKVRFIQKIKRD